METDQPLPKNRAGEPEQHTPFEIHQNHEYFQKEYLIAVAEVKLMQKEMRECFYKNGINQFEECKEIREKLWKKIHTPNYGAPGPSRSSSRFM